MTPATAASAGPLQFARYAYPPNSLGYCGPADPQELLGAVISRDAAAVTALAAEFAGAWPYLQLIAGCNGIADPLDRRVTGAYWVGSPLLHRVPPGVLAASLDERFASRAGGGFPLLAQAAHAGGLAHHNFHVFAVSPWIGMLRSGKQEPALLVLDRCRIRWSQVASTGPGTVTVWSRPLQLTGSTIGLGPARLETARWHDDAADASEPAETGIVAGDWVSLHWDWACERLSRAALRRLRACTARNLHAVNASPAPGPAVAADARGG